MKYDELVKALRCSDEWNCKKGCYYRGEEMAMYWCESRKMRADAADAIEALQAQLPKRGEWIDSKERMRPDMCSVCGCVYEADRFMDKIAWNYCPNCGSKMKVQDG